MVINIKQYLKETNSVLLTEQAYKYLKEKADVIEKLEEIKSDMDVIAEIEAIKAEIKDLDLGFFDEDYRAGVARGIMEFNKILNNHISELKGEQDESNN